MDTERQRVQDDLRGMLRGDVFCDPLRTQLYASDASLYQIEPVGVVRPRTVSDVVATVQYAAENDLTLHPRGAGSGVAGESLGTGLVIDFSRFMRRLTIAADASRIEVQAGAALAEANRSLRERGRWFGPDPLNRSITTIGGVLARNSAGSHYLRSGSARDVVESMRVVTAEGELLDVSRHATDDPGTVGRLATGLTDIATRFGPKIRGRVESGKSLGGYRLDDLLTADGRVDLAKFLVGTQGTLAILIDATLRTEPIPAHRGVALLFFHRLDMAIGGAVDAMRHGLVACDLVDRRALQIARDSDRRFADLLPTSAEGMVLVEIQGESLAELENRLEAICRDLSLGTNGAFETIATTEPGRRDLFWALSRRVVPRMYRFHKNEQPVPFIDDLSIPRENLAAAIPAIQDTLKQLRTTATLFAHVGEGKLQVRPFLNLSEPTDRRRLNQLSISIAEVVWAHGGEVSVDHASGLSRTYLLPRQFGDLWQAMGQVKRLFDPEQRFNPGKLFGTTLQKPNENLRPADQTIEVSAGGRVMLKADPTLVRRAEEEGSTVPQLQVLQNWAPGEGVDQVARACNGCGRCRTTAVGQRQCPMFRIAPREEASPRAKANLLRGVIAGRLPVEDLSGENAKAVADLCFNCHQCRAECPAGVDIPKLVGELKAQYVATNGLPLSESLLGHIDTVAAVASRVPMLANFLIRNKTSRWLAERLFGLSAARELPVVVRETFLRHAAGRRWHKPTPQGGLKVLYFVDQVANYHDPEIGKALAEILQQNGIGIYVPSGQLTSGMARITSGDLKGARRIARRNVRLLVDAVRNGYTVLATEPSAVLCLKHEYPNLLDDEDAHLVAKHSHEACEFLWELHQNQRLSLDFAPIKARVVYHQPCHLRVLDPVPAAKKLLGLVPRIDVDAVEAGCSGMAGTWGLQRKNYRNSLRIGWPMISAMRAASASIASSECAACRMQIEHGGGKPAIHPIKLLAHAYGRLPSLSLGPI